MAWLGARPLGKDAAAGWKEYLRASQLCPESKIAFPGPPNRGPQGRPLALWEKEGQRIKCALSFRTKPLYYRYYSARNKYYHAGRLLSTVFLLLTKKFLRIII